MKHSLVLGLVLSVAFNGLAQAVEDEAVPSPPKVANTKRAHKKAPEDGKKPVLLTPIGVKDNGDEKKPHREFFHEGVQLTSYQQIQEVITPLGDPEADRLIRSAKAKQGLATTFDVVGGVFCGSGLLYELTAQGTTSVSYPPYGPPLTSTQQADPAPAIVLGGLGILSAIFGMVADGDGAQYRDQAVTRYNDGVGKVNTMGLPGNPLIAGTEEGKDQSTPDNAKTLSASGYLANGPKAFGFGFSPMIAIPISAKTAQEYVPGLGFGANLSFVLDPHWSLTLEGGFQDHPVNQDYIAALFQQDYGISLPPGFTIEGGWSYIPIIVTARYSLGSADQVVTPYLLWGMGLAFNSVHITASYNGQNATISASENDLLLCPGLGVDFRLAPDKELYLQGRIDMIFTSQNGQDTFRLSGNGSESQVQGNLSDDGPTLFLPIEVGLRFWR